MKRKIKSIDFSQIFKFCRPTGFMDKKSKHQKCLLSAYLKGFSRFLNLTRHIKKLFLFRIDLCNCIVALLNLQIQGEMAVSHFLCLPSSESACTSL